MIHQKKTLWVYLATLGPIGYLVAPGTAATLVTMPCMYLLHRALPPAYYLVCVIILGFIAITIINRALDYFKQEQDPSEIVLDEFIGCLVTFYAVPLCWQTLIAGFLLFRFFDITKWFGIHAMERVVGAWGIVLDDLLAGILAQVIIRISYFYIVGQ